MAAGPSGVAAAVVATLAAAVAEAAAVTWAAVAVRVVAAAGTAEVEVAPEEAGTLAAAVRADGMVAIVVADSGRASAPA